MRAGEGRYELVAVRTRQQNGVQVNVVKKIAVVIAGSGVALVAAVAPATAASGAYNERTQTLAANPAGDGQSCVQRSIYLAKGTYQWQQLLQGTAINYRDITLAAGWYTWQACITPTFNESDGYWGYADLSTLSPSWGGTAQLGANFEIYQTGTYTWGDGLVPLY